MARMSRFRIRPLRNEVCKLEEVDISVSNPTKTIKEAVLNIREVLDQRSLWWLPNPKMGKRIAVNLCDESPTQQPCMWDSFRSTAGLIRQLPANASLVISRLWFYSASGDPQRDTSGSGSAIRGTKRYGATATSLMDRDESGRGGGQGGVFGRLKSFTFDLFCADRNQSQSHTGFPEKVAGILRKSVHPSFSACPAVWAAV